MSFSITHRVLSEHQDQAITAWRFYRPPRAIATGHISVPDAGQMASSPIKDTPVLGPAPGSHPVQMDDIACAFLCFAPWGCGFWALLCCSKRFKISALRSSKVCGPSVRTAQFSCGPSWLLMRTLPFVGIHSSFIVRRISVCKTVSDVCWVC